MRILAFLLLLPALSFAQVPHTFQNGDVADAEKINQNFDALNQRLLPLETLPARDYRGVLRVNVDCNTDATALATEIKVSAHLDPVNFWITGNCEFLDGLLLLGRQITISGESGAEIRPKLLMHGSNFQAKNSGVDFTDLDLDDVSLFNLSQNTSITFFRTNFINTTQSTRIFVRPSSNLRLVDSLQSDARPPIKVTAGSLWIRSIFEVTKLGDVSVAVGSRFWCRFCNVDIPNLILDTASSFCASAAWDLPDQGTAAHLNLGSLSVLANAVFIHDGAPSAEPPYSTSIESGSVAQWNITESPLRCQDR